MRCGGGAGAGGAGGGARGREARGPVVQARILEWVANSFSRGSSQPRDATQVSDIVGRFFTS